MSEQPETMIEALGAAIDEFLVSKGGGMRLAYVYAVDVIDKDGNSVRYLGSPAAQELCRSVGLCHYLMKYLDLEIVDEIGGHAAGSCDRGDD